MMESLRIVFMGTPDFAVPSLRKLHQAGHTIAAVLTQPDKQRGRGKKVTFSPVKELAVSLGIPVFQPVKMKEEETIETIRQYHPDVIIVIAYGKILPKEILDIPRFGCLNVHGSILPKYRGAAPIQWAIHDGEERSGVTIMKLDEGMDTGDILATAEVVLAPDETTGSLFDKLASLGADRLLDILADLPAVLQHAVKQDESQATYTSKIDKDMAHIDWHEDAVSIERLMRMLNPQPGAFTLFEGKRLKIWRGMITSGTEAEPGTIIAVSKKHFTVQTGKDALMITEVQPESRKRMAAGQFLQGVSMVEGMQL